MANARSKIKKFLAIVLIAAFASFFTCITMIDVNFLLHLWLPYLVFHILLGLIVKYFHGYRDKKEGEKTRSGLFLTIIYIVGMTACSIIHISIITLLCINPYCTITRFNNNSSSSITYTIIGLIEYFNLCLFFDFCFIKCAGTRNILYRLTISYPISIHSTTVLLSSFILWLYPIITLISVKYSNNNTFLIKYSTFLLYLCVFILSSNGLYNSLFTYWTNVYIDMKTNNKQIHNNINPKQPLLDHLDDDEIKEKSENYKLKTNVSRCDPKDFKLNKKDINNDNNKILRICQITDPHIGPLMSVNRLKSLCNDIIRKDPDLVLLTGDYFTGEANMNGLLIAGLSPLKSISSRCFACLGNHDMENDIVLNRTKIELNKLGIKLLQNESIIYDKIKHIGPIQIIGFDYIWFGDKTRGDQLRSMLNQHKCPQICSNRRIVLLHDPGGFKEFNDDENIVVFSGHTHGGMIGVVSCSIQWTMLYAILKIPDHGLWQKGLNKLYIHRGQGSRALYGNFVLRVGVPTEQSIVHVEW